MSSIIYPPLVEQPDLSWQEFTDLYPVFVKFAQNFKKIDGFWEASLEFKSLLIHELKSSRFKII